MKMRKQKNSEGHDIQEAIQDVIDDDEDATDDDEDAYITNSQWLKLLDSVMGLCTRMEQLEERIIRLESMNEVDE